MTRNSALSPVPRQRAKRPATTHKSPTFTRRGWRTRGWVRWGAILLLVHIVLPEAPQDREQDALATIGDDLGNEAAEEKPRDAILGDYRLEGTHVRNRRGGSLLGGLDHSERVGACVRYGAAAKANESVAGEELGQFLLAVVLGQRRVELVVRVKPRVVPHESRAHGTQSSVVDDEGVEGRAPDLRPELLQAVLPLHLQDGLASVDRHQEHAEPGRSSGGRDRLHFCGQVLGRLDRIPQLHHACVGCCVAKARERALQECGTDAAVETEHAAFGVQVFESLHGRHAVPVLEVDCRAHPHERADVNKHGNRSGDTATRGLLGCILQSLRERQPLLGGRWAHEDLLTSRTVHRVQARERHG
mmetsp:Transcript_8839/g.17847  ORF Transcript_8839/g.17847 Transcript_8839/m.17847 type:complete len:359 (+) Transcript_8839:145-1221(+)